MSDNSKIHASSSYLNFVRALQNLKRSVSSPILEPRDLSGIIKDFEMTYELSWKVLKKVLLEAGHQSLGSKDVFTQAYRLGYLSNENVWLRMIEDRNHAAHVYDEEEARKITSTIISDYVQTFEGLLESLN